MTINLTPSELATLLNIGNASQPDFTAEGAEAIIEFYNNYGDSEPEPTIATIRRDFAEYGRDVWLSHMDFINDNASYFHDDDDEKPVIEVSHAIAERITNQGTALIKELNNRNILICKF